MAILYRTIAPENVLDEAPTLAPSANIPAALREFEDFLQTLPIDVLDARDVLNAVTPKLDHLSNVLKGRLTTWVAVLPVFALVPLNRKVQAIKAVRNLAQLNPYADPAIGLREAKRLVDEVEPKKVACYDTNGVYVVEATVALAIPDSCASTVERRMWVATQALHTIHSTVNKDAIHQVTTILPAPARMWGVDMTNSDNWIGAVTVTRHPATYFLRDTDEAGMGDLVESNFDFLDPERHVAENIDEETLRLPEDARL